MTGTTSTAKRPVPRAPIPLRVSDPGADPRVTRQRARRDGYVFCRALVPRDRIDALRGHALAVAEDLGWLDANAPRNAALAEREGVDVWVLAQEAGGAVGPPGH